MDNSSVGCISLDHLAQELHAKDHVPRFVSRHGSKTAAKSREQSIGTISLQGSLLRAGSSRTRPPRKSPRAAIRPPPGKKNRREKQGTIHWYDKPPGYCAGPPAPLFPRQPRDRALYPPPGAPGFPVPGGYVQQPPQANRSVYISVARSYARAQLPGHLPVSLYQRPAPL